MECRVAIHLDLFNKISSCIGIVRREKAEQRVEKVEKYLIHTSTPVTLKVKPSVSARMGCGTSSPEIQQQVKVNRLLDAGLASEAKNDKKKIKLLLLGAGESGKSTVFKQMKVIYGKQFSAVERKQNLPTIYANVISNMHILIKYARKINIIDQVEARESLALIEKLDPYEGLNPDTGSALKILWLDPAIQRVWARRHETQVTESIQYFFNKIDLLKMPTYLPDKDDMLYCRFRTSGIVTEQYIIDGVAFEIYDVGGQRNERRKWIHCFENVTGIIFIAGLSEFNQVLYEENSVNRMAEALDLFEEICNNSFFSKSSIILYLNKRDLFEEKINHSNIADWFPEYRGPINDYEAGVKFFLAQFLARNNSSSSHQIYHHVTCATDTRNIQIVFNACKDIIMRDNLKRSGIISEETGLML
jgi:GTPase SAR1 family protein